MSEVNRIDISLLKIYKSNFKQEYENFTNTTYNTFSSSYLKRCTDPYVSKMNTELQGYYDKIKKGYQNIDKWWANYNKNIESLEKYLSGDGSLGAIDETSVRSYVSNLPELSNYTVDFADTISTEAIATAAIIGLTDNTVSVSTTSELFATNLNNNNINSNIVNKEVKASSNLEERFFDKVANWWEDTTDSVGDFFSDVGCNIGKGVKSLWSDAKNWWSDVNYWWDNSALPWIKNAASVTVDVFLSVCSTISTTVFSLVEGLLQFGESIVDFVTLAGTAVASIFTGAFDLGQAVGSAITGEDWNSATKKMWEGTKGFVSNQYVTSLFDSFYQDTNYGKLISEKAYGFETVRSVSSGIGNVAGVILLTICTFGIGGAVAAGGSVTATTAAAATTTTQMAATAAFAGMGKGTQNAWNDGASLGEGLTVGGFTGLWEGLQFYLGGKIGNVNMVGEEGLTKLALSSETGTKVLNSLSRVILDGADSGVEGLVQPIFNSIYKDGYYNENNEYIEFDSNDDIFERYAEMFNDNGGWSAVWTEAAIGGGSSVLGEVFDLGKYFKQQKDVESTTPNTKTKAEKVVENIHEKLQPRKSLESQIENANKMARIGKSSIITVDSLEDIPKELFSQIDNPSLVNFKVNGEIVSFVNAKYPGDLEVELKLNQTSQSKLDNLQRKINDANYYTNKGMFYTIDVDSLEEIPKELFSQIDDPSLVNFRVNGEFLSFYEAKHPKNIEVEFNLSQDKSSSKNFEAIIRDANYRTSHGIMPIVDIDSLEGIPKEMFSQINEPQKVMFRVKDIEKVLSFDETLSLVDNQNIKLDFNNQIISSQHNNNVGSANSFVKEIIPQSTVINNLQYTPRNVNYLNNLDNINSQKSNYLSDRNKLAYKLNISKEEAQKFLDNKIKDIISDSSVAIRADSSNIKNILQSKKIKNLFETGTGKGSTDLRHRMEGENYLFGIPDDTNVKDRPIYGLGMPNYNPNNKEIIDYYKNTGKHYGDAIIILKKDKIVNNTTFTCGDSLEFKGNIAVSDMSKPSFKGSAFENIFSKIDFNKNDLSLEEIWENISLESTFKGRNFLEFQIHGEANHSTEIIDKIIFSTVPDKKTQKQLLKSGILWEVLPN